MIISRAEIPSSLPSSITIDSSQREREEHGESIYRFPTFTRMKYLTRDDQTLAREQIFSIVIALLAERQGWHLPSR
ncbi:hypothetical protein JTE90_004104 [Oedothorax gibbosus]|uniref:Uncharacterized protein n=1 Tax=Oedothorax gibbosus TaxID=931172 RepID=A0AAV6V1U0_9ARAC|nr:hypothetical protein JTE90_004104 [Oedothorax gibbosus]